MKNLTEFSGVILRRASQIYGDLLAQHKAEQKSSTATDESTGSAEAAPAETLQATEDDASTDAQKPTTEEATEATDDDTATEAQGANADVKTQEETDTAPLAEGSEPVQKSPQGPDPAQVTAKLDEALGLGEARAGYLFSALKAITKKKLSQVRNVRVFEGEEGPKGAISAGEIHFVVDWIVLPQKTRAPSRDGKAPKGKGRDGKAPKGKGGDRQAGQGRPSGQNRGGKGFDGGARDERPGKGGVPSRGLGWSLSRAPEDPSEKRGRKKSGKKPRGKKRTGPDDRGRGRGKAGMAGNKRTPEVTVKAPTRPVTKPAVPPEKSSASNKVAQDEQA